MTARKAVKQTRRRSIAAAPDAGAFAQHASDTPFSNGMTGELRLRAEALALKKAAKSKKRLEGLTPEAIRKTLFELSVHQIELEMQNETLRQSQVLLDTARARYFDFYDLAPVGYCTVCTQLLITEANLFAASLLGVTRSVLVKQPFLRFIHGNDQGVFMQFCKQIAETGKSQTCTLRLMKPDQSLFWVQLNAITLPDRDRAPEIHMVLNDIGELKRTEEALRAQEEFFHLIAENIGDFIAVLDLDGRRIYNSPSYRQFFGSPKKLRGTDSFTVIHPDDRERVKQVFRETVQTGIGQQIVYRLQLVDGSSHTMESSGSVIRDNEGRIARVVVVSRDITERKRMEEQVRQLAFYDPLTQLPNRRLLSDRLNQAMAASKRSACYGAVMFLDLDNFKLLNDTQGHVVGDLLLVEAAKRLKSCVREMDTVARFGGDEFVLMISELDADKTESTVQVGVIAEKIFSALSQPFVLNTSSEREPETTIEHRCSASVGVALFVNQEASQDDILKWADAAMYRAKEAGRNLVRFHE